MYKLSTFNKPTKLKFHPQLFSYQCSISIILQSLMFVIRNKLGNSSSIEQQHIQMFLQKLILLPSPSVHDILLAKKLRFSSPVHQTNVISLHHWDPFESCTCSQPCKIFAIKLLFLCSSYQEN